MAGEEPTQARHDAMSAWMLAVGNTQTFVDNTLGPTPAGRSAAVIGETVYVGQRQLPPGVPAPPWALNIQITRVPGWQGALGWRAILIDWAGDVAPASTAITTWTEPDASGTSIVHGPFNWDATAEEWYVDCSPGFETGNAPVFFSVLYGSAVWAAWTMLGDQEGDQMLYVVNGEPEATAEYSDVYAASHTVLGAEIDWGQTLFKQQQWDIADEMGATYGWDSVAIRQYLGNDTRTAAEFLIHMLIGIRDGLLTPP